MDDRAVDVTHEFSCFLCNGYSTVLGSIKMEDQFLRLATANGYEAALQMFTTLTPPTPRTHTHTHTRIMLESMQYSDVGSVTEEDPPTQHSLFLNRATRVCTLYASNGRSNQAG